MNNIRMARKQVGMTAKQLGEAVGVSEAAISHYETGKRQPSFEVFLKIAEVLGCSTDFLLSSSVTPEGESMEEYVFALRNSPERRQLLDMTMWMPKEKLQRLIRLIEVWNE